MVVWLLWAMSARAVDVVPPKAMLKQVTKQNCPGAPASAEFVAEETINRARLTSWTVRDCGDEPFIVTWVQVMGAWSFWTDGPLRKKAPFDLACPIEQVTYTFIDAKTRGVEGCERRATYMFTTSGWTANVTSQ